MNPTYDPTATHGMQNKQPPLGESGVELSSASLYDSEQIPVLIRMPDLTPDVATMPVMDRPLQTETEGPPPPPPPEPSSDTEAADSPRTDRRQRRRESARAGRNGGSGPLQTLWSSFPSTVLVMVVLLSVTGIVYVLMRGEPQETQDESTVAWSSAEESEAADPDVLQIDTLEAPSEEPDLWSEEQESGDATALTEPHEPAAVDDGLPPSAEEALWGPEHAGALDVPAESDGPDGDSSATPSAPWAEVTPSGDEDPMDGPILSWGPDELLDEPGPADTGPVQGWPPEMDGGFSAGASGGPSGTTVPNAGGTYFGNPEPSTPYGGTPSLRTGMRDTEALRARTPPNAPEAATFKGTIEFPQPRVNDERTQPGVF
jgi:hypothetical protein